MISFGTSLTACSTHNSRTNPANEDIRAHHALLELYEAQGDGAAYAKERARVKAGGDPAAPFKGVGSMGPSSYTR